MSEAWFKAVDDGDLETVLRLIGDGIDVDTRDSLGRTALSKAVRYRLIDMTRTLLGHGADPNAEIGQGITPVTYAVERSLPHLVGEADTRALNLLLAAGGRLGLCDALLMADVALARRLFDEDPDLRATDRVDYWSYRVPYLKAAATYSSPEMVELLIERGADLEACDDIGETALIAAAMRGIVETARILLDHGARVDHDDWSDRTPLSEAAIMGHRAVVELLLERGATRGLLDAVALDEIELARDFLEHGADPNHRYCGPSTLAVAARRGSIAMVALLLEHGAHPNENEPFYPPLVEAVVGGHLEVVRLLLAAGADPRRADRNGKTALDLARESSRAEMTAILEGE
ncbi:MAG: ankyrin repeat domain-containing protein [Isosphaeraceae bacterium]|nr:ankyrin repeat domain-containing protein [Isosphaeraceae bacterium]